MDLQFVSQPEKPQKKVTAYFDGCFEAYASQTTSYGGVVYVDGIKVWQISNLVEFIPGREDHGSSNVGEYCGLVAILKYLLSEGLYKEDVTIYGDSMLVICQMFGDKKKGGNRWQIKSGFYVPYARQALILLRSFKTIQGQWIPREQNTVADKLSKAKLLKKTTPKLVKEPSKWHF